VRNRKNYNNGPVEVQGLSVEVKNGDFNRALRKFKKMVQEDGILQELREREYYEKPTTKRKRAKAAARARHLKSLKKRNDQLGY
jgi:small subunit ribosomal protein S21